VATIRDCFLVDLSVYAGFEVVYCGFLKPTQNQIKKHKKCYIQKVPDMVDKVIYTSNTIMDLKKALFRLRKMYIQPFPKLIIES
jgi:hypothetical protein